MARLPRLIRIWTVAAAQRISCRPDIAARIWYRVAQDHITDTYADDGKRNTILQSAGIYPVWIVVDSVKRHGVDDALPCEQSKIQRITEIYETLKVACGDCCCCRREGKIATLCQGKLEGDASRYSATYNEQTVFDLVVDVDKGVERQTNASLPFASSQRNCLTDGPPGQFLSGAMLYALQLFNVSSHVPVFPHALRFEGRALPSHAACEYAAPERAPSFCVFPTRPRQDTRRFRASRLVNSGDLADAKKVFAE